MRHRIKRLVAGGAGLTATAVAVLILTTGSRAAVAPPMAVSQMQSMVSAVAAGMGEGSPSDITYSAVGTRNQALTASGSSDQMGGSAGSAGGYFVIEAHGNFTAYGAALPPGDETYPTGQVLFLIVNAATGDATDVGMGPAASVSPDLSALGAVTSIAAPATATNVTTTPTA